MDAQITEVRDVIIVEQLPVTQPNSFARSRQKSKRSHPQRFRPTARKDTMKEVTEERAKPE